MGREREAAACMAPTPPVARCTPLSPVGRHPRINLYPAGRCRAAVGRWPHGGVGATVDDKDGTEGSRWATPVARPFDLISRHSGRGVTRKIDARDKPGRNP